MTERIYTAEQLYALPEHGVEAQKIRALFLAYGGDYDFCRFFRHGESFLAALDGSFVIAEQPGADHEEIAQFLCMHGYTDIFCSEETGDRLKPLLPAVFTPVQLMVYCGQKHGGFPPECTPMEAWSVIGSRFGIPFEPWYLDMSHRVRHGITRCFSDGKAALVLQHDINGEALISQVSVLRESEGQGIAGALVRQISAALSGEVQVICEERLCGFYEKCGYRRKSQKFIAAAPG
ncbi:MAG: GNAT family N-acetyltransferase [Oscillospiraceae bacterium]|nr:GNAT family N-acetyltransferase [Oscillospiraceae bacterium]